MKHKKLLLTSMLCGLSLPVILPTAQAAIAPNGKIAYTTCEYNPNVGDTRCDIWVMEADGSNPVNITNTPDVSELSPSWSGDGQKIAYTSSIGLGFDNIWVMNADGSNPQQVTFIGQPDTYAWQGDPSFSPDGTKIAFTRHRPFSYIGDQTDIFVINVDGTGEIPITNTTPDSLPLDESAPAWSPDGSKIAFSGARLETYYDPEGNLQQGYQREIVVVNPDGSGEQILSAGEALSDRANYLEEDHNPAWSPDGTKLLFSSQSQIPACCNPWQNWMVNADGSGLINISSNPEINDGGAVWSPDGTQILFTRDNGVGGTDLFVMPVPIPAAAANQLFAPAATLPIQLTNVGTVTDTAWAAKATAKVKLTVIKAGNGRGLVKSSPVGISCGNTCSADFNLDTLVTITASAAKNDRFLGWGGACARVFSKTCTVKMDKAKNVVALFFHYQKRD